MCWVCNNAGGVADYLVDKPPHLHAVITTGFLSTNSVQGRLKTLALCETSREDVVANIGLFLHPSNVYKVSGGVG